MLARCRPTPACADRPAAAQGAPDMQISWEVRNRFRLFREERDFLLHADSARGRSILASEQALELQSDGRGWARNTVNRLCIDLAGRVSEPCTRDNVKESYLTPTEHPVTVRLTGASSGRRHLRLVVRRRRRSAAIHLRLRRADQFPGALWPRHRRHRRCLQRTEAPQRVTTEIMVRDIFIAGLGDSIASGEGNPDRADRAVGRGLLLPLLSRHRERAILPSEPRRLQRRPGLRSPGLAAGLAAPERALVQFRLPPLAVQLPDPHRAGARRAISAHRGDLSAAGLHRRHHRRRAVRRAARARMPADEIGSILPGHGQRATGRIARSGHRRETPSARPQARSGAAVDRRQRHQFFRAGRRRDRRQRHRARAVPAHRRDGIGGGFARGDGARPAAGIRQAARGVEAAGRRHVARRLRVLRQSDAGRAARPAPAAAPASIFIRRSTPIRSGSPTSPTMCRANFCRS